VGEQLQVMFDQEKESLVNYLVPSSTTRQSSSNDGVTGGRSSQPWGCTRCGFRNFKKVGTNCSNCSARMPFVCELCPTGFTRKANLNKHKKRTHKEMMS